MHPVHKSRSIMTNEELFQYSPETKVCFQIVCFLANLTLALENSTKNEKGIV